MARPYCYGWLLKVVVLSSILASTCAFIPIVSLGLGGLLFRPPGGIKILPSLGENDDLMAAADFFTDAFWASKLSSTSQQRKVMKPRQRSVFLNSQITEFRRRYGSPKYSSDRTAELLLAKRRDGSIIGCCGIEIDRIPNSPKRQQQQQQQQQQQVGRRTETSTTAPLMSNLAVGKQYRRLGVARDLVLSAETMVQREWGYDQIYLYVEQRNVPALKLYQSLGYQTIWVDNAATSLIPSADGNGMAQCPTTLLCMRKSLKRKRWNVFF